MEDDVTLFGFLISHSLDAGPNICQDRESVKTKNLSFLKICQDRKSVRNMLGSALFSFITLLAIFILIRFFKKKTNSKEMAISEVDLMDLPKIQNGEVIEGPPDEMTISEVDRMDLLQIQNGEIIEGPRDLNPPFTDLESARAYLARERMSNWKDYTAWIHGDVELEPTPIYELKDKPIYELEDKPIYELEDKPNGDNRMTRRSSSPAFAVCSPEPNVDNRMTRRSSLPFAVCSTELAHQDDYIVNRAGAASNRPANEATFKKRKPKAASSNALHLLLEDKCTTRGL